MLCPFVKWAQTQKHLKGKLVWFPSPWYSVSLKGKDIASHGNSWSVLGTVLFTSAYSNAIVLSTFSFKGLPWKRDCCSPLRIIAPRNFLTVRGCVSGSLFTAHLSIQGSLCLTKVVGGCAKMARELKWNSQILPPTCHSLIKASVLFSLAICLLHDSKIVAALCDLLWLIHNPWEQWSCNVLFADIV